MINRIYNEKRNIKFVPTVSYNYKKLNSALNKLSNGKKYDIAKAAKLQRANVKSYVIPYDTYQSFYVCGKNIYEITTLPIRELAVFLEDMKLFPRGERIAKLLHIR